MSLRALVDKAQQDFRIYKNPNVKELIDRLNDILNVMGRVEIDDCVVSIGENSKDLIIFTSYSVRQCEFTDEIHIPLCIIDSENPEQAAEKYLAQQEFSQMEEQYHSLTGELYRITNRLEALPREIAFLEAKIQQFKHEQNL